MLNTRNQVRITQKGAKLTAQVGNPLRRRDASGYAQPVAETANLFGNSFNSGGNSTSVNALAQNGLLYDTMLNGVVGDNEKSNLRFYRDIYHHDQIPGAAVDLISTMPFSDFTLEGCEDKSRVEKYMSAIEALNFKTLLPEIAIDHLVTGSVTATPVYKASSKKFVDIIAWRSEDCTVTPTPFLGVDPLITVRPSAEVKTFLNSQAEYFVKMRQRMNPQMLAALQNDEIELDPLTTIYVPRKTFTYNHTGTSYYKRILPLYLIEKALYRGTLIEAGRRQRSLLHLPMGDDMWEPTPEEMQAIVALFQQADLDPLGAIVGTRSSVSPVELRQGGEFWKYHDLVEATASMKLRALGISESFLSGDATYNSMEVSLSVFVENLRAYRNMMTQKIFYGKLFPLIAYSNRFTKKAYDKNTVTANISGIELKHDLNDATMLDLPRIHWEKALRPEADQAYLEVLGTLKEQGVPIGLATWAAAGGMTTDQLVKEATADKELKKTLTKILGDDFVNEPNSKESIEDQGGEFSGSSALARQLLGRRRRSLLSRKFEHEISGMTPTGKPKYVFRQTAARNRQYDDLAKAVKSMSKEGGIDRVLAKVKSRVGRIPNVITGG